MDRLPIFNIKMILEKILEPYVIVSSFINSSPFDRYYITADEQIHGDEALEDQFLAGFHSATYNYSHSIPGSATNFTVLLFNGNTQNYMDVNFDDDYTDPNFDNGSNYDIGTYKYTCPADCSYRFLAELQADYSLHTDLTNISAYITVEIRHKRGAVETQLVYDQETLSSAGSGTFYFALDTKYIDCQAGDEIWVKITWQDNNITNTNPGAVPYTCTFVRSVSSYFKDYMRVQYADGATITIADWIPNMKQIDFIKSLNQLFNLVWFFDEQMKNVYIEPFSYFYTTNVKDWTTKIDHTKTIYQKLLSNNFEKVIHLKFREDSSDILLNEYDENSDVKFGGKKITLNSEYTKNEIRPIEGQLSTFIMDQLATVRIDEDENKEINHDYFSLYSDIPCIWGDKSVEIPGWSGIYPTERIRGFNPKIMKWVGLQPGNWTFEGSAKTYYPAVSQLNFDGSGGLYLLYFLDEIRRIDQGKQFEFEATLSPLDINPFHTKVGAYTSYEGFRAKYKFKYKDEYFYGYISRIYYDGQIAKIVLIQI
jgi:hypothetical protein